MNEPIKYREYVITFDKGRYFFQHYEFTGAEDKRYGDSGSLLGAEEQIDKLTIEEQEHTITILRKKVADLELALEIERRFSASVSKENLELKN